MIWSVTGLWVSLSVSAVKAGKAINVICFTNWSVTGSGLNRMVSGSGPRQHSTYKRSRGGWRDRASCKGRCILVISLVLTQITYWECFTLYLFLFYEMFLRLSRHHPRLVVVFLLRTNIQPMLVCMWTLLVVPNWVAIPVWANHIHKSSQNNAVCMYCMSWETRTHLKSFQENE